MRKFKIKSILLWVIIIPICILAIYCFYTGAMISLERQLDEFSKRIAQTGEDFNYGAVLIVMGMVVLFTIIMAIINIIVHCIAGNKVYKIFFNKKEPTKSDPVEKRIVFRYMFVFILFYVLWFLYGLWNLNIAYMIWCVCAIIVTIYYLLWFEVELKEKDSGEHISGTLL